MKIKSIYVIAGFALASAAPALAQSSDAAYCQALAGKYQHYLGGTGVSRNRPRQRRLAGNEP